MPGDFDFDDIENLQRVIIDVSGKVCKGVVESTEIEGRRIRQVFDSIACVRFEPAITIKDGTSVEHFMALDLEDRARWFEHGQDVLCRVGIGHTPDGSLVARFVLVPQIA